MWSSLLAMKYPGGRQGVFTYHDPSQQAPRQETQETQEI